LATVACASGLERLEACAALAEGRVAAAEGDERAVGQLKRAVELFASLELPLDAARAQLELARTLAASAPTAAVREGTLALATVERLGALPGADAAAGLLRGLGVAAARVASWGNVAHTPRGRGAGPARRRLLECPDRGAAGDQHAHR
jgi:exonuclease VII small subunit